MTRRALAAGLLALTFVAACSDDPDRRSSALPPPDTSSSPEVDLPSAAPTVEEEPSASTAAPQAPRTTSPAAVKTSAPAPATTSAAAPQKAQPTTQQTTQAAPGPASKPSPTRTATKAPAPAPTRSTEPAPAPAGQFALTIEDFAFSPRVMTVPVGSTVTATNKDQAIHDWTSNRGVWGSGDLRQGQMFSFTFKDAGTYDFLCERHSYMTGTVNVTPR